MQLSPSQVRALPAQVYAFKAWKANKLSMKKRRRQLKLIIGGTGSSQGDTALSDPVGWRCGLYVRRPVATSWSAPWNLTYLTLRNITGRGRLVNLAMSFDADDEGRNNGKTVYRSMWPGTNASTP